MNKNYHLLRLSNIFLCFTTLTLTQASFAEAIFNIEDTSAEGGYFLIDNFNNELNGGGFGSTSGGDSIDNSLLPTANNISGFVGADIFFNVSNNDHLYTGQVNAGAKVLDPSNQLSFIQADGEAILNFNFELLNPHAYTLTDNNLSQNFGQVDITFDSKHLSQLDSRFELTGTLATGSYGFNANNIAALSAAGTTLANFNFELQLTEIKPIPVPAAVWLFLSGLIGLSGLRKIA